MHFDSYESCLNSCLLRSCLQGCKFFLTLYFIHSSIVILGILQYLKCDVIIKEGVYCGFKYIYREDLNSFKTIFTNKLQVEE